MKTKWIYFVVIFMSAVFAAAWAAPVPDEELEARKEQLRQDAQASFAPVKETLESILKKINLNQRPDESLVKRAGELLENNRRNATVYEATQKSDYMLLQSWTSFFQNDPVSSMNWATRACRENLNSGDAWVSQNVMSLVYGRRPMEPTPPRPPRQTMQPRRPRPTPRGRQAETTLETPVTQPDSGMPYGQPGILTADLRQLQRDFLREQFTRLELMTTDGKKVTFVPGTDILCMLIWKGEEVADPNAVGAARPQSRRPEPEMDLALVDTTTPGPALDQQQAYFKMLSEALADKKEVKFVEINVNTPAGVESALAGHTPVAPLVVAANPQSGATGLLRRQINRSFMAIVDKEGKVKYAGPAADFIPAFMLTRLTGAAIDLEAYRKANPAMGGMEMTPGMMDMMFEMMPQPDPNRPRDPNTMRPQPQPQPMSLELDQPQPQYRQLPLEQQIEAEKQMGYARGLFAPLAKKRGLTPKKLVDICREVMRKYPDTSYAQEARDMLRQLPEKDREIYNITDQELGL